ncbi:MAG: hypothetical protein QM504_17375, partial [Pseudomonadota bacterium]
DVRIIKDTGQIVWNAQYEEWLNPADFNPISNKNLAAVLSQIKDNPPAAGGSISKQASFLNETADEEYQH